MNTLKYLSLLKKLEWEWISAPFRLNTFFFYFQALICGTWVWPRLNTVLCFVFSSGAQGEYAGLRVIQSYQRSRGEGQRDVCLIPVSAHGTNPASAQMCGLRVVPVHVKRDATIDMDLLLQQVG